MRHGTYKLIALGVTSSFIAACGPPSRDGAVDQTARKACQRYEQCDALDDNYSSYNECLTDWENRFYDTWPADQCGDGRIDPEQLDECQLQIETFDCDNSGLDIIGVLFTSCSARQVCG